MNKIQKPHTRQKKQISVTLKSSGTASRDDGDHRNGSISFTSTKIIFFLIALENKNVNPCS